MNTIKEVNLILFQRYIEMVSPVSEPQELELVYRLCKKALHTEMYEDKHSRWLGFVQGVLYSNGMIDLEVEGNMARKLFHAAYERMGKDKPETIDV